MEPNTKQQKYYINYSFFKGDEFTGESTRSGLILEAESDKEARYKVGKYVVDERGGELTKIHKIQNITELLETVADAINNESELHQEEGQNQCYFTDYQKYNVGFVIAHWLYSQK